MALTINALIAQVQRRFPDAQTPNLLSNANSIHRQILSRIPELRRDTVTLSLVAGQQEYDIAETVYQVNSASYKTGASTTSVVSLMATSVEELDSTSRTWRSDANGPPLQYYLSSNQSTVNSEVIGFYPTPDTTTTGGYPLVLMATSNLQPSDLGLTDTCLVTLASSQVYVEGVSWLAAIEIRPQMVNAYQSAFESEMDRELTYVRTRNEGDKSPSQENIRSGGYGKREVRGK